MIMQITLSHIFPSRPIANNCNIYYPNILHNMKFVLYYSFYCAIIIRLLNYPEYPVLPAGCFGV